MTIAFPHANVVTGLPPPNTLGGLA